MFHFGKRVFWKLRTIAFLALHQSVQAGKAFAFRGTLVVRGPGKVSVGDYVMFDDATGHNNRLLTFNPNARITIGDRCYLNGVEIACKQQVLIGDGCIIAECLIMDTDFHSVEINRHEPHAPVKTVPIVIGRNVWIANKTIIIRGVRIGDNSVIGAGSVVTRNVPDNVIVAGNPAQVIRSLKN